MSKKDLSKTQAHEKIKEFFSDLGTKSPKDISKIKQLAMNRKISLKEYRKKFCKNCSVSYSGKEKVRIKNKIKSVTCSNCGKINRWKIK